jgi:hypothetical protein
VFEKIVDFAKLRGKLPSDLVGRGGCCGHFGGGGNSIVLNSSVLFAM